METTTLPPSRVRRVPPPASSARRGSRTRCRPRGGMTGAIATRRLALGYPVGVGTGEDILATDWHEVGG